MRRNALVPVLLCLLFLAVGFVVGVAVNATYGPNHIVFQVQPSTKVNLAPRAGDVIDWVDWNGKPISAQFQDNPSLVPCQGGNVQSRCVVTSPSYSGALYPYTCTNCFDPVIGPVSKTQVGGGAVKIWEPPSLKFWPILVYDLERLLHLSVGGESAPATPAQAPPPVPQKASVGTGLPVQPALACLSGKVAVYPPDFSPPDLPVSASANGILQFTGSIPYTATEPTAADGTALCVNGVIPTPAQACAITSTAKGNYTYTVSSTSCAMSPTETITVH
jgi:hypothetical protein